MDTAEAERLWEREAARGVEQEAEEEEVLLEPEAEPDVSRDDSDVHSQNYTQETQAVD